jgi:ATP-dependent DNA helicase RecQ
VRDQLGHLEQRFGIPAAALNSDQTPEENEQAIDRALGGELKILFLAPEQLDNLDTAEVVSKLSVSLLVVDEAHCISTWGHDFRPSYRQIVKVLHQLQERSSELHVLGLTATADQRTEGDIARQLADPRGGPLPVARETMDRPNIALGVAATAGLPRKLGLASQLLAELDGCGILYCATRDQTEIVARFLREQGHDVISYHAGYDPQRKRALQQAFIGGQHKAIAATNALGMGIDKPDIRFIVHVDVPGSITAYYQEVGRAGRDGQPARGILLFDADDRRIQEHFIRSSQPTPDDFEAILREVCTDGEGLWPNQTRIKSRSGLHPTRVTVVLAELMEQGFIEKIKQGKRQVYALKERAGSPNLERYVRQRAVKDKELEAMLGFGERQVSCLMQTLRVALGDRAAEACGHCSLCRPQAWSFAADQRPDNEQPESERPDSEQPDAAFEAARRWLEYRDIPIPQSRVPTFSEGLTLLNSEDRAPLYAQFMRRRANEAAPDLPAGLSELLSTKLASLAQRYQFAAVVGLPSRTWAQRQSTLRSIGQALDCPLVDGLLCWDQQPETRQGERLNNDQRKENVSGKMGLAGSGPVEQLRDALDGEDNAAVLLVDDYIGSGHTLKEAVRTLRKQAGVEAEIVPLTMAKVRWRLGRRGMI